MTTSKRSSTTLSPDPRGVLDGIVATMRVSGLTLLRGRRGFTLMLLCALPLIAPGLELVRAGAGAKGAVGFVETLTTFYFARVNLIVVLFLGCGALGEEIEGKTLPYLLTRPVPRAALLLGRWLTAIATAAVLLGASFVALYLATAGQLGFEALLVDLPVLGWALVGLALSLFAYCAFFVLLSVLVRWPLLVGLTLLFVWEEWAATMPGTTARYTVLHHVYTLLARMSGDEGYVNLARPFGIELLPASESLQVLLWVAGLSLLIALWRFRRKSYLV